MDPALRTKLTRSVSQKLCGLAYDALRLIGAVPSADDAAADDAAADGDADDAAGDGDGDEAEAAEDSCAGLVGDAALAALVELTAAVPDYRRYIKIECIPGGDFEAESRVLDGVVLNKEPLHPEMPREVASPRVVVLDCDLDFNKGESKTSVRIHRAEDYAQLLAFEETYIRGLCDEVLRVRPTVVITEKGCSDLAQECFARAGVVCLRRLRKSDSIRVARATGATIIHTPSDLKEAHVGTRAARFHTDKLGDEYYSFLDGCTCPGACTVWLRGPSRDYLAEVRRNLEDALAVAANLMAQPAVVPGGGAIEICAAIHLAAFSTRLGGVRGWPAKALAIALEVIPRTLVENCGGHGVRVLTELRAKHTAKRTAHVQAHRDDADASDAADASGAAGDAGEDSGAGEAGAGEDPGAGEAGAACAVGGVRAVPKRASDGHWIVPCTYGVDGERGTVVDQTRYGVWDSLSVKLQLLKTAVEAVCVLLRIDEIVADQGTGES